MVTVSSWNVAEFNAKCENIKNTSNETRTRRPIQSKRLALLDANRKAKCKCAVCDRAGISRLLHTQINSDEVHKQETVSMLQRPEAATNCQHTHLGENRGIIMPAVVMILIFIHIGFVFPGIFLQSSSSWRMCALWAVHDEVRMSTRERAPQPRSNDVYNTSCSASCCFPHLHPKVSYNT